ncbi:phage late control D family protein [Jeongeupia chitinilytica]|uniref:Phage late control protein n=1 Tax=Jeongeupia chitinilytica TaxID=1041641 RepID=A0ABQ3GYF6_9NEIS|nr:phage late control D family protein [Jeongeupia chitinilytica]GHD59826.1 phage late control protein [Jeongeupia chitinilytica]
MSPQPVPIFRVVVDGRDISGLIDNRLESLSLTDNRGFEADQLDIVLHDHDGALAIPPLKAEIRVWLGWQATGLIDKGTFTVDEVEHSGAPDKLTIRARSADLADGLLMQRERSFHRQTVGAIVRTIAGAAKLEPSIAEALAKEVVDHIDQTNESDANFLTRLGQLFDAVATVKAGRLLFMPMGACTTASGQPLERVLVNRQAGDQHRYNVANRDNYSGVRAEYQNNKKAKKGEVVVGKADNLKTLRHVYATQKAAERAAKASWNRIQRGVAEFGITLALGRPEIVTESPATVTGFKADIDNGNWTVSRAAHTLDGNGLATSVEFELRLNEVETK